MIRFFRKENGVLPPKHRGERRRRHLLAVLAVAAAASVVWACVYTALAPREKYVDTWKEAASDDGAPAKRGLSSAGPSSADAGLSAVDADDFLKVQRKDYPIIKVKRKDPKIENILIIGIDGGDPGGVGKNRADCIIVASVDTRDNALKLSSLMRDTKTYFPNTGDWHKLNAAYSYGGAGLLIDIVNYAYKLDCQEYILMDFEGFENIINTVGGVKVELTAKEASYPYINAGTAAGIYDLNGKQALGYARTRKIDNDFLRTQRQRNIIEALYKKYKNAGISEKLEAAGRCIGYIETNVPTSELLSRLLPFECGMKSRIGQIEIPSEDDGMYTVQTSPAFFWNLDWGREVTKLQSFIYGTE